MPPISPVVEPASPPVVSLGLVEDNDADIALVHATLRRTRMPQVTRSATHLRDALRWVDSPPACILLDLGLPDADGLEGLDVLVERLPTVPVVILTGHDDLTMASDAMAHGAQDYLVKGQFDAPTLERTIRHAIDRKRAQLELDARRRLNDAVLDSIDAHTAVVDHRGVIISVNAPWRRFAVANDASAEAVGTGVSYLDVCRRAAADGVPDAAELCRALEDILADRRDAFTSEYACHGGGEERWFSLRAVTLGPAGAVLVHLPITDHKRLELDLTLKATHDPLTGLPNRGLLHERLGLLLDQRTRGGIAVAFVDLDGFKAINDQLGHGTGDHVLVHVGQRLLSATRDGDVVARIGGDEFVVVGRAEDQHAAVALGDRLAQTVAGPTSAGDLTVNVSASVGVAHVPPGDDSTVDDILARADSAMYDVKRRRPGSVTDDLRRAGR